MLLKLRKTDGYNGEHMKAFTIITNDIKDKNLEVTNQIAKQRSQEGK